MSSTPGSGRHSCASSPPLARADAEARRPTGWRARRPGSTGFTRYADRAELRPRSRSSITEITTTGTDVVVRVRLQVGEDAATRPVGQPDVEHDGHRPFPARCGETVASVAGHRDGVAAALQVGPHQPHRARVVLDEQDHGQPPEPGGLVGVGPRLARRAGTAQPEAGCPGPRRCRPRCRRRAARRCVCTGSGPSPVPSPGRRGHACWNESKIRSWSAAAMPTPVSRDGDLHLVRRPSAARHRPAVRRELHRVRQQVEQHLLEAQLVGAHPTGVRGSTSSSGA